MLLRALACGRSWRGRGGSPPPPRFMGLRRLGLAGTSQSWQSLEKCWILQVFGAVGEKGSVAVCVCGWVWVWVWVCAFVRVRAFVGACLVNGPNL